MLTVSMSVLSEYYLKLAKDELREDENRKSQSLAQFRELIAKHPSIKKCRSDDKFLLAFLRTKKYSTDVAMTLLENYFIFLQKHPKMFSLNDDATNKRIKELYDSKVVFPLTPRDEKGRRGFLIQLKYINAKTINITDLNALSFRSSFYMLEEEETQIAGIFYMIDFSDTNMSELFCKISLLELKEMCESIVHSMPGRFKGIYLINVPQAAQFLVEIIKLTASKKLRDRIILLKNHNEFKNHFSMKIMPKELGGEIPEAEMIEEFRGIMKQNEEANKMIYDFKIDSNEMFQFEKPGSFRTLNID